MLSKVDFNEIVKDVVEQAEAVEEEVMPWDAPPVPVGKDVNEMTEDLLAGLDTAETRRYKDIYWAFYRLLRRDKRNQWYRAFLDAMEGKAAELPPYTKFGPAGEGTFDSEKFKQQFEASFGTPDNRKLTVEKLLLTAKKFWKEAATERSLIEWAKEDSKNYRERVARYATNSSGTPASR